ncbi:MAG: DUF6049 family protein [Pseudolysinimonas sp.]
MSARRFLTAALAGCALIGGGLAIAAPASGASSADAPPETPGSLTTAAVTPGDGPVSVAIVLPLTVPPTTTGLLDAETLTSYTAPGGLLTRQLDAVAGTSVAIGLDPMVVASIRVLGTVAPDTAVAFLERLSSVPNEVFLLAYADADPSVTGVATGGGALDPLGFDFAIDPADFGPAATPTPTSSVPAVPDPAGTGEPDSDEPDSGEPPPLPETADLLAWSASLESIAWPAEGRVGADGLSSLTAQGYADVLLAGSNVSEVSTALADLGDIDGIVADTEVTAAVRDATYAATSTSYQEAIARLGLTLQTRAAEAPGRTIVATLDRRWPFGTLRMSDLLTAIDAASASQLVTLGEVLAGPRENAQLVEAPADDRADTAGRMVSASSEEIAFLTIAEDAALITQPRRLAMLGLSAAAWDPDDPVWVAATDTLLSESRATLEAVQITQGSDLLLLSDISTLRMQVSNALPVSVTVYLSVRPLRPLLHVEDPSIEVTIEPDSTSTASVPVESIANGDVTVRAELLAANGRILGSVRFVKVILQAGWETAGTLIAGTLVVLVFGGGLIRSIVRRRREAAAGSPAGADD